MDVMEAVQVAAGTNDLWLFDTVHSVFKTMHIYNFVIMYIVHIGRQGFYINGFPVNKNIYIYIICMYNYVYN